MPPRCGLKKSTLEFFKVEKLFFKSYFQGLVKPNLENNKTYQGCFNMVLSHINCHHFRFLDPQIGISHGRKATVEKLRTAAARFHKSESMPAKLNFELYASWQKKCDVIGGKSFT